MLVSADQIQQDVELALKEDIGTGDLTAALVADDAQVEAHLICRQDAVLAGCAWFSQAFYQLDKSIVIDWHQHDGDHLQADQTVCKLSGRARPILSGERVALNFLQTLSAVATQTDAHVQMVAATQVNILDTRKTLPGLRIAQKYAVTCGGGINHRVGLYDAILIKENHIAATGSVKQALLQAQAQNPQVKIEIEVETIAQLEEALAAGARHVLLDNFNLPQLREAVLINNGNARLEASGGVDLNSILEIAKTGVDDISVGAITKDIKAVDFSLLINEPADI